MFYEDDGLLNAEYRTLEHAASKAVSLSNSQAVRHLKEGFIQRHLMMQSSRIFMRENTQPSRTKPLDPYLTTELNVHVNAYYLNLCGALDNLAWLLTYELALNPTIGEADRSRIYSNLFGERFLNDLAALKPSLAALLRDHTDWNREIRTFRDPAAHRIPLYMAPGILNEKELEEFYRIAEMASQSDEERGGASRASFLLRARELAKYYPVMVASSPSGLQTHSFPEQLAKDHETFLRISDTVIDAL